MAEITENIEPNTEWYSSDFISMTLTSAEQLSGLASLVNEGTSFAGQTVYLGADIDLGYYEWIPIGTAEHPFCGSFDGQGYAVRGLKIHAANSYIGLFGYVSGKITGFSVESATVYLAEAHDYISLACGYAKTEIKNVTVSGFIDAAHASYIGGVAGYTTSSIRCYESKTDIIGANYVGGIPGFLSHSVSECENRAEISAYSTVGGVVGYLNAAASAVVSDLENKGAITGQSFVGGLIGICTPKTAITLSVLKNSGSVSAKGTDAAGIIASIGGESTAVITVNMLENTGAITALDHHAGGLFAFIKGTTPL